MKYKKQKISMKKIYNELNELYMLHKIQQDALWSCYDEQKDYGHIFSVDTIYSEKFTNLINKIKTCIC